MILAYWHWIIFGLVLMAAEMLFPGAFFLWIGAAAICVGTISYVVSDLPTAIQLVLFGICGPLFAFMGRKIMRTQRQVGLPSLLNRRGQQMVGKVFTLDVPIVHGHAHATIGDSKWRVQGPDLPAMTDVQVVDVDGNMLIVVPVDVTMKE